jgi:hypothetical protein
VKNYDNNAQVDISWDGPTSPLEPAQTETLEAAEYAMSGWFKFFLPEGVNRNPCHTIFRLTNNEADHLSNSQTLGDRTLGAFQCKNLQLGTYSIGSTASAEPETNRVFIIDSGLNGEYVGLWTYIYMGYSRSVKSVSYFVAFPDK